MRSHRCPVGIPVLQGREDVKSAAPQQFEEGRREASGQTQEKTTVDPAVYSIVDRLSKHIRTKANIGLVMALDRILDAPTLQDQTKALAVVLKRIAAAKAGAPVDVAKEKART